MNKWQRIAAAFPLVMTLIDSADDLKGLQPASPEWDQAIAKLVDNAVNATEIAVGKDLIDNAKLREALLASLNITPGLQP